MIDLWNIRVGTILTTLQETRVEVLSPTEDGEWILGRILAGEGVRASGVDLVHVSEVAGVSNGVN